MVPLTVFPDALRRRIGLAGSVPAIGIGGRVLLVRFGVGTALVEVQIGCGGGAGEFLSQSEGFQWRKK